MSGELSTIFYNGPHEKIIHKWAHYLPLYEKYLSDYVGKEITVVEIGVNFGGSLDLWRKYFGDGAHIIGTDINEWCKSLETENVSIEIGDQGSREFWTDFKNRYKAPDIIIDDGSHIPEHQIVTFEELFPFLKTGGIYICEDTHTSYQKSFGAGFRHQDSFIEYAKGLTDEINAWWSDDSELVPTQLTRTCDGIHFHDSMIVFEKTMRMEPYDVVTGNIASMPDLKLLDHGGVKSMYRTKKEENEMPGVSAYPPIGTTLKK